MGGSASTPPPSLPPPPFLEKPWRNFDWGAKHELLEYVRNYKPEGASHVRVLLCGPVGSGKTSFINSVSSVLLGRSVCPAETCSNNNRLFSCFTLQYNTHRFRIRGVNNVSIVFNDTMGLENSDHGGVQPEDIILAMKGHMKDGYRFSPGCGLSPTNPHYNPRPSIDDKVHVLAFVLSMNAPSIPSSISQKMKIIREAARDLGIPQVIIVTHFDQACEKTHMNVRAVFRSTYIKRKIDLISRELGVPPYYVFPVWNNYEDNDKDAADTLILAALKQMLHCEPSLSRENPSTSSQQSSDSVTRSQHHSDFVKLLSSVRCDFVGKVSDPVLKQLLDRLLQERVMTLEEMDCVKEKPRADKARDMVDTVIRKGQEASSVLIREYCELDPRSDLCKKLKP